MTERAVEPRPCIKCGYPEYPSHHDPKMPQWEDHPYEADLRYPPKRESRAEGKGGVSEGLRGKLELALPDALSAATEGGEYMQAPEPSDEPGSPYVRFLAHFLAGRLAVSEHQDAPAHVAEPTVLYRCKRCGGELRRDGTLFIHEPLR